MKSIKEKSEEYSSGYMNLDRQQVAKQAFDAGANYVLDEIEKSLQEFSNYEDSLIIIRIIEQLKK